MATTTTKATPTTTPRGRIHIPQSTLRILLGLPDSWEIDALLLTDPPRGRELDVGLIVLVSAPDLPVAPWPVSLSWSASHEEYEGGNPLPVRHLSVQVEPARVRLVGGEITPDW